jgi:ABC-2 type transport system permease protein
MTAVLTKEQKTGSRGGPTSRRKQFLAMIRMELILLRRSWATMGAGIGLLAICLKRGAEEGPGMPGAFRLSGTIIIIGVFMVHHHLAIVYATRRQDLVLKRLRSATPSEATILIGTGSGAVIVYLAQALGLFLFGLFVLDQPLPTNPLVLVMGVLLGATVMAAFAALMSAITRSAEAAMLTTLPTMGLFLATPGVLVDFGTFPAQVEEMMWWASPLGPLPELLRVSWTGVAADGERLGFLGTLTDSLPGLLVLVAWIAVMAFVLKRLFRWEPREGRK